MATLSLARRGACFDAEWASAASLPDWLEGRSALVFSHPNDFAALDFEADRWRRIVADALAAGNVRPLRVLLDGPRLPSWIEQMSEEDPLLVLAGASHPWLKITTKPTELNRDSVTPSDLPPISSPPPIWPMRRPLGASPS